MKVLVIGKEGQLARALAQAGKERANMTLSFAGRPEVDMATVGAVEQAIRASGADLVINAAAYTAVDRAEAEEALALRINGEAAGEAACAAAAIGADFIQVSTDYVFDGRGCAPYAEHAPTAPVNAYGRTKLAGEAAVRAGHDRALIVRTSWLVSPFGHNFVRTMLRLAGERDEISVVDDQRGSPTSALDLAKALLDLGEQGEEAGGIVHLANAGEASWAELAEAAMAQSAVRGGPSARIRRIATSDYPTPAQRPANTVLDCTRARRDFGIDLPDWRSAVARIVEQCLDPVA